MGYNPQNLLRKCITSAPVMRDDLKMGTTQQTGHIPGYDGFLPIARTHTAAYR